MSAAEPLTLDRLLRTALEDRALERAQALLTDRARLELAAELLASLGVQPAVYWHDAPLAFAALQALGGAVAEEMMPTFKPPQVEVRATLDVGTLRAAASFRRSATLDDARRLLEGQS